MVPGRIYDTEAIVRALRALYVTKPHAEGVRAYRDAPPADEELFEITGALVVGRKLGTNKVHQVVLAQKHLATGFMVVNTIDFAEELLDELERAGIEAAVDDILTAAIEAAPVEDGGECPA